MNQEQEIALHRLADIVDEAGALGEEAADLVEKHFPGDLSRAQSYAAFDAFTSPNPYDITLDKIIKDIWSSEAEHEI